MTKDDSSRGRVVWMVRLLLEGARGFARVGELVALLELRPSYAS